MKNHHVTRRPLVLARETIRTLSHVELGRAAGASETEVNGSPLVCTTYDIQCKPPRPNLGA